MKRDLFIKTLEALEEQMKHDISVSEKLGEAFPNAHSANLLPDNYLLHNIIIEILQESMNDKNIAPNIGHSWIEYFCYELNFGSENYRLLVYDEDKNIIPMSNAGELYDFLINR